MAQVKITIGQIEVGIEDEDAEYGPLAELAEEIVFHMIERAELAAGDDEEDEDG